VVCIEIVVHRVLVRLGCAGGRRCLPLVGVVVALGPVGFLLLTMKCRGQIQSNGLVIAAVVGKKPRPAVPLHIPGHAEAGREQVVKLVDLFAHIVALLLLLPTQAEVDGPVLAPGPLILGKEGEDRSRIEIGEFGAHNPIVRAVVGPVDGVGVGDDELLLELQVVIFRAKGKLVVTGPFAHEVVEGGSVLGPR